MALLIGNVKLELTLDHIKWAIVGTRKLKVKQEVREHSDLIFEIC